MNQHNDKPLTSQDMLEAFLLGAACASKDAKAIAAVPFRTVHEKVVADACGKKGKDYIGAWLSTLKVEVKGSMIESVIRELTRRHQERQAIRADLATRITGGGSIERFCADALAGRKQK